MLNSAISTANISNNLNKNMQTTSSLRFSYVTDYLNVPSKTLICHK